jgi:Flp pilus assembly protein TadD
MVDPMNNAPLSLELVPMDVPANDETVAEAPARQSSPTTSPAQDVVAAAEASLDAVAIEIKPVERALPRDAPPPDGDAFIAQALREYAQGHLDTPLWDRALKHNDGDAEAAAAMYIPARAVALRMLDRKRREAANRAAAAQPADDEPMVQEPVWQRYRLAIVAAALIVPAAIAGAVYMTSGGEQAVAPAAVARAAPRSAAASPAAKATAAAPTPAEQAAAKEAQTNAKLAAKVQELRDAGNFNVMVLYATEWTRKEPRNVAAWDELRVGYLQLKQYEDARSAARKAVQLAPEDARLWRNLAALAVDLDDPEAALAAYEEAAARNPTDVESLNAVGLLHARLGRPQESKAAFDRATAASPGDALTTCLRTGVAQMPVTRDAYTMSRQVRAIDDRCHGRSDGIAAAR